MDDILNDIGITDELTSSWEDNLIYAQTQKARNEYLSQAQDFSPDEMPKPEHLQVLSKVFGHKVFKSVQWKIINSIMKDKRDNVAIMTTGYGKSLCYQFPAVFTKGLTLVVSPLISLMEDQVLSLKVSEIPACLLGSAQTQKAQVIDDIFQKKYSVVYLTPEYCTADAGKDLLIKINKELTVTLVAIDEAHCVSHWGHDFRYAYRSLGILKNIFPNVPFLAVTATATVPVRQDIIDVLRLRNPQVLCTGFDRPNLFFSVYYNDGQNIFDLLRKHVMVMSYGKWVLPGTTIIYTLTRKAAEEVSELLNLQGIQSLPYHAGLSLKKRKETHEMFVKDKVKVIVATIAFGMGIDKPDIRNIIHFGTSNSLEGYYQEVGRAGRDGMPSKCITFYSDKDFRVHEFLRNLSNSESSKKIKDEKMKVMKNYLITGDCRRKFILSYFEDERVSSLTPSENCCDNCIKKLKNSNQNKVGLNKSGLYDFTADVYKFLSAIDAVGKRFGISTYIKFIRGLTMKESVNTKNPLYGIGKSQTRQWWNGIASLMEREGYIVKENVNYTQYSYQAVSITKKGHNFVQDENRMLLTEPTPDIFSLLKDKRSEWIPIGGASLSPLALPSSSNAIRKEDDSEKEERMKLYRLLMNKRSELAQQNGCMPFTVASNAALMEIARLKPTSVSQLRNHQVDGFTEQKLIKFGEAFVSIIRGYTIVEGVQENKNRSIKEILSEYPLNSSFGSSPSISCALFKGGLRVAEIASKRGMVQSTVISHLCDGIKTGLEFKLSDLDITDDIRNTIINAIKNLRLDINGFLTPIKSACPEYITFDQIKCVCSFLQVRQHLKQLNIPYEEFEEFHYEIPDTYSTEISENSQSDEDQADKNLDSLLNACQELQSNDSEDMQLADVCEELEKSISNIDYDSDATIIDEPTEPPAKRNKNDENVPIWILDSPPRENKEPQNSQESKEERKTMTDSLVQKTEENVTSSSVTVVSKKKKLPPWLQSKKTIVKTVCDGKITN